MMEDDEMPNVIDGNNLSDLSLEMSDNEQDQMFMSDNRSKSD
jgi:hypothetical protein